MASGDSQYAAMSLCNISAYSCDVYQHSFALEAAESAVKVASEDSRCWSQLANVYIHLNDFDKAESALRNAEIWGDKQFAASSRARILRQQGHLSEAQRTFEEVIAAFQEDEGVSNAYCGLRDILRDIKKYDESIVVFDKALERFGTNSMCWDGKAKTLETIGRLKDAHELYTHASKFADSSVMILYGVGRTALEIGDLKCAKKAFKRTIVTAQVAD